MNDPRRAGAAFRPGGMRSARNTGGTPSGWDRSPRDFFAARARE